MKFIMCYFEEFFCSYEDFGDLLYWRKGVVIRGRCCCEEEEEDLEVF